jgi:hypothetical protein
LLNSVSVLYTVFYEERFQEYSPFCSPKFVLMPKLLFCNIKVNTFDFIAKIDVFSIKFL